MKKLSEIEKKRLIKEGHKILDQIESDLKLMFLAIERKKYKNAA